MASSPSSRPLLAAVVALLWVALVLYGCSALRWLVETVERVHAGLDEGAIADHDGTERPIRESDDEFRWTVVDD
jgi:hypothetical protein